MLRSIDGVIRVAVLRLLQRRECWHISILVDAADLHTGFPKPDLSISGSLKKTDENRYATMPYRKPALLGNHWEMQMGMQ